jgi:hypothetical protein
MSLTNIKKKKSLVYWEHGSLAYETQISLRLRKKKAYDNRVFYILLYSQLNPYRTAFDLLL